MVRHVYDVTPRSPAKPGQPARGARAIQAVVALSRLVDGLLALPSLVVALAIVGVLGKSFANVLPALILAGAGRIVGRHILPNIAGPTLVPATLNLGNAILGLTALSFLGLGVQAPQAEWGAMINNARGFFDTYPWVMMAPGLAISGTVLAVNVLGDAIRDATDPRRSRR